MQQQAYDVIITMQRQHLSAWPTYLVDAKVGIGVEVVVSRCHFLWANELGSFAATGAGG